MTDCINGSNLSKNENKQIKALPPYIIQSLLASPNKPKHVADDRRPKNALFASFVNICAIFKITIVILKIKVITKLPNSEQSYKGKVKTHNYINRQNQSTTGKL